MTDILVLTGPSNNGVLDAMAQSLAASLNQEGAAARLLYADPQDLARQLAARLAERRFDAVFAFAAFGAELLDPLGRSMVEASGAIFVGWTVDHPSYHYDRMMQPIARRVTICANPDHFAFLDRLGAGGRRLAMLPGVDAPAGPPLSFHRRRRSALVALSWLGEPERWWATAQASPAAALISGVVDRLLADSRLDLLRALDEAAADLGVHVPMQPTTCKLLAEVVSFVRRHDRIRLVEALVRAKVPLTLLGRGWADRVPAGSRVQCLEPRPFASLGELLSAHQVVLNVNGATGACERALGGMAAGAAVVSDFNPLLERDFAAKGALRLFDRAQPDEAVAAAGELLESDRGRETAERGLAALYPDHLWSDRARRLLQALSRPEAWPA